MLLCSKSKSFQYSLFACWKKKLSFFWKGILVFLWSLASAEICSSVELILYLPVQFPFITHILRFSTPKVLIKLCLSPWKTHSISSLCRKLSNLILERYLGFLKCLMVNFLLTILEPILNKIVDFLRVEIMTFSSWSPPGHPMYNVQWYSMYNAQSVDVLRSSCQRWWDNCQCQRLHVCYSFLSFRSISTIR